MLGRAKILQLFRTDSAKELSRPVVEGTSTPTTAATPPESKPEMSQSKVVSLGASSPLVVTLEEEDELDLPIYEATEKELDCWHTHGTHGGLQSLLREYDLEYSGRNVAAYCFFRVGYDKTTHRATFVINPTHDPTHYHAIDFNANDSAPLNKTQARRVLEKISATRKARSRILDRGWGFTQEFFV